MTEAAPEKSRVAEFCAALPSLRADAAAHGWSDRLRETVDQLTSESAGADDPLRELWRFLGLQTDTRGSDFNASRVGLTPTPPPAGAFQCPRSRCTRVQRRLPGDPPPDCELYGQPMVWHR